VREVVADGWRGGTSEPRPRGVFEVPLSVPEGELSRWVFQDEFGWVRKHYPNQAIYFLTLTAATIAVRRLA
jgi:hypothetical protein